MLKGDKKIRVKFLTPDKPPSKQAVEPTPPARSILVKLKAAHFLNNYTAVCSFLNYSL